MDINENIGNDRKITETNSGYTFKTTLITDFISPKLSNLALN